MDWTDWTDYLEPTKLTVVLTVLLFCYWFFVIPFVSVHSVSCRQEGVDCSSADYYETLYYCLKIQFHEEFETMYMYSVRDCTPGDILWLILIVPLLYVASLPVYTWLIDSMYARESGSLRELLTWSLCAVTLMPALIFSIIEAGSPESPLVAYIVFPFWLLYKCAFMVYYGDVVAPAVVFIILAAAKYGFSRLFREWEIPHSNLYVIWVLYLVLILLGALFYGVFYY